MLTKNVVERQLTRHCNGSEETDAMSYNWDICSSVNNHLFTTNICITKRWNLVCCLLLAPWCIGAPINPFFGARFSKPTMTLITFGDQGWVSSDISVWPPEWHVDFTFCWTVFPVLCIYEFTFFIISFYK